MYLFNHVSAIFPNFLTKKETKKYLAPLAIKEKTKKGIIDMDIIPAEMVKSLYGIGLNPAMSIIIMPYLLKYTWAFSNPDS